MRKLYALIRRMGGAAFRKASLPRRGRNAVSSLCLDVPAEGSLASLNLTKAASIFTHMTLLESLAMYAAAKHVPPGGLAAEIGSYLGSSTCFICQGLPTTAKLICIDTWENDAMKYTEADVDAERRDTYQSFHSNTLRFRSQLVALRKWSHEAIGDVSQMGQPIDLLFIDGDHNYEGVIRDWTLYSPLLAENAIVAFHDIGWAEGVQRVVSENVAPIASVFHRLPNLAIYRLDCNRL